MNAIVKQDTRAVAAVPENELIHVMQGSLYPGADEGSIRMVLAYCRARGLDPMLKPVHIVPMWDKEARGMRDVILPGIPLYRIQAARSGSYAGKTEPEFGPEVTRELGGVKVTFPLWCKVTVEKIVNGQVRPFTAKEFWLENYATAKRETDAPNTMWRKRVYGQLAKCAEAQALRMAFPEETGGEPTAEEMEGKSFAGPTIDATAEPAPSGSMREAAQKVQRERADMDETLKGDDIPEWKLPAVRDEDQEKAQALIATVQACATEEALFKLQGGAGVKKARAWYEANRPELAEQITTAFGERYEVLTAAAKPAEPDASGPLPSYYDAGLPNDPLFPKPAMEANNG